MKHHASASLSREILDTLFYRARTYSAWRDIPIGDEILHTLAELVSLGPTSANCEPIRLIFVRTKKEKERLIPCLAEGNKTKTMAAPVTVIVGYDTAFYEKLPILFPYTDARSWFADNPILSESTAFRNSSLQGGYLIIAARALGLDCGPMSGFDNQAVDQAFFQGSSIRSNFICNLGYGDPSTLKENRPPRLNFEDFCTII